VGREIRANSFVSSHVTSKVTALVALDRTRARADQLVRVRLRASGSSGRPRRRRSVAAGPASAGRQRLPSPGVLETGLYTHPRQVAQRVRSGCGTSGPREASIATLVRLLASKALDGGLRWRVHLGPYADINMRARCICCSFYMESLLFLQSRCKKNEVLTGIYECSSRSLFQMGHEWCAKRRRLEKRAGVGGGDRRASRLRQTGVGFGEALLLILPQRSRPLPGCRGHVRAVAVLGEEGQKRGR
jgi:hypothetical protein